MNITLFCPLCQENVDKKHPWRVHKLNLEAFIYKYHPRKDLQTGEQIKFNSDLNRYFETDFLDKRNFNKWLKDQEPEIVKEYLIKKLKNRKEYKNLIFAPCQVELQSLKLPKISYFNSLFENYYELCEKLGLKDRFIRAEGSLANDNKTILIDTREQKLFKFDDFKIETLTWGDYALEDNIHNIRVERKSLVDFISSFGGQIERLEREILRAKENDGYLVILVEEKLSNCLAFNKLPWVSRKIKATPDFVFHNIRNLLEKYEHIQFLFCDGRKESKRLIEKLLFSDSYAKSIDLQLEYDLGRL